MTNDAPASPPSIAPCAAIVGGGPAGLFAAEILAARGAAVTVFEAKPSPARKLLMAGRGGLNLTHSEPLVAFFHPLWRSCRVVRGHTRGVST